MSGHGHAPLPRLPIKVDVSLDLGHREWGSPPINPFEVSIVAGLRYREEFK